jgi:hypothetical protein
MRRIVVALVLAPFALWGGAALWIDGPPSRPLAAALATGFVGLCVGLLVAARSPRRGALYACLAFAGLLAWWLSLEPSNDRVWEASVAHPPRAIVEGDLVRLENVRNFHYRSETDFDEVWETRTYDLSKLRGVDMFLSYWGSPWIAHTIVSWEFEGGEHLAVSIETRKEAHESYSAVLGFFRQFELYYVASDERDVIGVRTNHRGEEVYLYRLSTPVEEARAVLLDYVAEMNRLAERPRWYNALTHNCTTAIRQHVKQVSPGRPWNWRILVNGRIDELGYQRGTIDTSLPFEELRRRSQIVEAAQEAGAAPDFSSRIRHGLPGARGPDPGLPSPGGSSAP